jgi:hypothetical protein
MWKDPVVEKTRKLREEYAANLGHDPDAIFEDIRKRQERSERKVVRKSPRRTKTKKSTA